MSNRSLDWHRAHDHRVQDPDRNSLRDHGDGSPQAGQFVESSIRGAPWRRKMPAIQGRDLRDTYSSPTSSISGRARRRQGQRSNLAARAPLHALVRRRQRCECSWYQSSSSIEASSRLRSQIRAARNERDIGLVNGANDPRVRRMTECRKSSRRVIAIGASAG
jgi:hypothetical protein